jgi:hypothetical protein
MRAIPPSEQELLAEDPEDAHEWGITMDSLSESGGLKERRR